MTDSVKLSELNDSSLVSYKGEVTSAGHVRSLIDQGEKVLTGSVYTISNNYVKAILDGVYNDRINDSLKDYYKADNSKGIAVIIDAPKVKKMFCLNEDGVAEWIVAENQSQALFYAASQWGIETVLEEFENFLKDVPDGNYAEFIDSFVKEEDENKTFTHMEYGENHDQKVTKTIKEFLADVTEVPSYFAHQDY